MEFGVEGLGGMGLGLRDWSLVFFVAGNRVGLDVTAGNHPQLESRDQHRYNLVSCAPALY